MSRVADIINNARHALADPNAERWSNDRLLSLLSKGQRDFARETRLLMERAPIKILLNVAEYSLPADAYLMTHAVGPSGRIPFVSTYQLDEQDPDWKNRTGDQIKAIVYDLRNPRHFRLYPVLTSQPQSAPYEFDSLFGVMVELNTFECVEPDTQFGVAVDTDVFMHVRYIKKPEAISTLEDYLEVPEVYDDALEHYVTGMAFRDDMDTRSQAKSAEHLQQYYNVIAETKRVSSHDSTQAVNHNVVQRRIF